MARRIFEGRSIEVVEYEGFDAFDGGFDMIELLQCLFLLKASVQMSFSDSCN
jgi:hypothetical protein